MQYSVPRIRDYLKVAAMGLHFADFRLIDAGLHIVAEVANVQHFLLGVPQERVLLSTLQGL